MKSFLTLSSCTLMLWSCATDSEISNPSDSTLSVTFTTEITSRVDTGGFELNDIISVAAYSGTTALSTNTLYSYDGAIFNSQTPIEYETSDQELTFTAVYPAQEGSIMSFDFEVIADQSIEDAYELSDLLTSSTQPTTVLQPELSFYHRMSSIVINIISDDDFSDATLSFNALNNVACDLSESTFEAQGNKTTIIAASNSNIGFKAILAPQTIDINSEFATLTIADKVYTWTLLEDLTFSSTRQYTFNWDVVTNEVSLSGIINDWGESDDEDVGSDIAYTRLSDYSATSYPTDTDEWYIYDIYTTTDDFAGLRDALNSVSNSGSREISIGFTNITAMPSSAFYESSHSINCLTRVSLPNVTKINSSAFYGCTSLTSISTPELIYIDSNAFYGCTSLTTMSTPELIYIGYDAFYNCTNLSSLNLSKVLTVEGNAFYNNTGIENMTLETLIEVGINSFGYMKGLKVISMPSATTINSSSGNTSSFNNCTSLQEVNIPNVTYVGGYAFLDCSTLQSISIPKATYIGDYAFKDCTDLMNLSIATESVLTQFSYNFASQETNTMTLTIGSANSQLVDGNVFKAPTGSGSYVEYTFKEIIVI